MFLGLMFLGLMFLGLMFLGLMFLSRIFLPAFIQDDLDEILGQHVCHMCHAACVRREGGKGPFV